jgi:hypothetical protein
MCQFGRHIFLFGGIDFENEAIYNDLYMLDTVSWDWKYVGEAGEEIPARNSHILCLLHVDSIPFLVLFGGASPELGPLGDTYYANLPQDGLQGLCLSLSLDLSLSLSLSLDLSLSLSLSLDLSLSLCLSLDLSLSLCLSLDLSLSLSLSLDLSLSLC